VLAVRKPELWAGEYRLPTAIKEQDITGIEQVAPLVEYELRVPTSQRHLTGIKHGTGFPGPTKRVDLTSSASRNSQREIQASYGLAIAIDEPNLVVIVGHTHGVATL
jgi:hypothetical protein